jgi:hypothetical protein
MDHSSTSAVRRGYPTYHQFRSRLVTFFFIAREDREWQAASTSEKLLEAFPADHQIMPEPRGSSEES